MIVCTVVIMWPEIDGSTTTFMNIVNNIGKFFLGLLIFTLLACTLALDVVAAVVFAFFPFDDVVTRVEYKRENEDGMFEIFNNKYVVVTPHCSFEKVVDSEDEEGVETVAEMKVWKLPVPLRVTENGYDSINDGDPDITKRVALTAGESGDAYAVFVEREIDEAAIFDCIIDPPPTKLLIADLQSNIKEQLGGIRSLVEEYREQLNTVHSEIADLKYELKDEVQQMKAEILLKLEAMLKK